MAETIGKQLKQAREAKNLTIQKVVEATHIRALQIEAIEADDFESLPSPVQARAYLRLYAEFLGFSLPETFARQRVDVEEQPASSSDLAASRIDLTVAVAKKETEPSPKKTSTFGNKLLRFLANIKGVLLSPKVPSALVEQTRASTIVEPMKPENEEPAAPIKGSHIQIPDSLPSQDIFIAIGKSLCERRESLSLTLDEIERHTHVGKHYLQTLEAGEYGLLPSSVQARGMLKNYTRFLNLDVDEFLLKFAEGLQTQRLERQAMLDEIPQKSTLKFPFKTSQPFKINIPSSFRRYFSVDIFVGGGLVLLLIIFAIWGTSRIINIRSGSTPQPTAPSIIDFFVSSPETSTATPIPQVNGSITGVPTAGETLVLTLPVAGQGPVQIIVVAQEQAWVRVTVDGKVQFEGRVIPGTAYPFDGNTQIEVLTGNGRAISILYNQNNLGPMGDFGEVVDHIYTANAILNPTATFTPTPTISPTPTITLRPTITFKPSSTLRPSTTPRVSPTPSK
jgi:cytoskeletal protein RodZ